MPQEDFDINCLHVTHLNKKVQIQTCANPERFDRGGPTLTTLFFSLWGDISKYHYKRAIIGPPAKHHLNGATLACWWWPNIECLLGSFEIFRGFRTVLLRSPKFLRFLRGRSGLDPMSLLWIRALHLLDNDIITLQNNNTTTHINMMRRSRNYCQGWGQGPVI